MLHVTSCRRCIHHSHCPSALSIRIILTLGLKLGIVNRTYFERHAAQVVWFHPELRFCLTCPIVHVFQEDKPTYTEKLIWGKNFIYWTPKMWGSPAVSWKVRASSSSRLCAKSAAEAFRCGVAPRRQTGRIDLAIKTWLACLLNIFECVFRCTRVDYRSFECQ